MKILKAKLLFAMILTMVTGSYASASTATSDVSVSIPSKILRAIKDHKISTGVGIAIIAAGIAGGSYAIHKHRNKTVGNKVDEAGDDVEDTADDAKDAVEDGFDDVKDQFKK